MTETDSDFRTHVHTALIDARVSDRIGSGGMTIVLERVAYGGGATNWYLCTSLKSLEKIESELLPGSVVSLYFDQRIRSTTLTDEVVVEIAGTIDATRAAVVGTLNADGIKIDVDIIVSREDLADFLTEKPVGTRVFYGAFPDRDNDGTNAITLTVPDRDGVVRGHPH